MGTVTTEGSSIAVTTNAGRAIAIILMLTGIGVFSIMTGAMAQHFLSNSRIDNAQELSHGERAIMDRLDELAGRLHGIEIARLGDAPPPSGSDQPIIDGRGATGLAAHEARTGEDTAGIAG